MIRRTARRALGVVCTFSLVFLAPPSQAEDTHEPHPGDEDHAHEHGHEEHPDAEVILVTPSPLVHARDELAVPVDRLDREEVIFELGTTLGDTLQRRPGITTTSFSGGASRPVIRGQDAFRTAVTEDSLGTQDASQLSPDHGVPVNPLAAKGIEVVRGPAALRYGGGAAAGVVNAITNRVPMLEPDEPLLGEIFGGWGSNANSRDLAFALEGGRGPVGFHIDGLMRESDDYETPEGRQRGTFTDANSVSAGVSLFGEPGRVGFAYARFENDYGIPDASEDAMIDMRVNRFRLDADKPEPFAGVRELRLRSVYTDYAHEEIAAGVVGQTFDNDGFEGRLEALHEEVAGFIGAVGLHGRYEDLVAGGDAVDFLLPTETADLGAYVFEEMPLTESLNLEIGFRGEYSKRAGTPIASSQEQTRHFPVFSGSAGLVALPIEGWTFGLTGSVNQRAPSVVELFARGPHEATGTFERGDPGLDQETSYTAELSARGGTGRIALELSSFATFYDDYIFGQLTGATIGPDALDELLYLSRDALFYGSEIFTEIALCEFWEGTLGVDGQFDFVRARFKDDRPNRNVPRVTPMRVGTGAFYRHPRFDVRLSVLHAFEQDEVGLNESPTNAFTFLDLTLGWRVPLLEDLLPMEVFLVARNLTDARARNHVAINKQDVLLPGRNVRVGVRATF